MYIRISLVLALSIGVLFVFALNSFALNFAYEAKSDFPYYLGSDTLDEENGGDFTGVNSYAIAVVSG